jgi:outer membrane biosynthesis protein TonB
LEDRIIYFALIASCLVHAIILVVSYFFIPHNVKAKIKAVEIVYHSKPQAKKEVRPAEIHSVADLKEARKSTRDLLSRTEAEKQLLSSSMTRDAIRPVSKGDILDKQPIKIPSLAEKRSITVPVLTSQKITNPQYLSYNDRIRDKIRNRAYFYIDDPKFQAGEVYMTFVVSADGNLKELQVINERSHANEYLRQVGLRSIKESSPFPAFPPELRYPELSFNVVISFEVSK